MELLPLISTGSLSLTLHYTQNDLLSLISHPKVLFIVVCDNIGIIYWWLWIVRSKVCVYV